MDNQDASRTPPCTPAETSTEPPKPWPDYPLRWFAPRKRYRKKHLGVYHYFSADPIASYDAWKEIERATKKGEAVVKATRRYVLEDARDVFLTRQFKRLQDSLIQKPQFVKYRYELVDKLASAISMRTRLSQFADPVTGPVLFETIRAAAILRGLQVAERHIYYVRAMLDYVASPKGGMLMPLPFYGDSFDKPSGNQIQKERNTARSFGVDPMWSIDEARKIIIAAKSSSTHLYAQLVLGAVAGYTSADMGALPVTAIDRVAKVINFPRAKNGRQRLCVLTPAIRAALDVSIANRPKPASPEYAHLVFLTAQGTPVNRTVTTFDEADQPKKTVRIDNVNQNLKRLIRNLDLTTIREATKNKIKGDVVILGRNKLGQSSFRSLNYSVGITAGVDKDFLSVLRGRQLQDRKIEEFYLRGDLRRDLEKLVIHIQNQFGITDDPIEFKHSQRGKDTTKRKTARRRSRRAVARPAAKTSGTPPPADPV